MSATGPVYYLYNNRVITGQSCIPAMSAKEARHLEYRQAVNPGERFIISTRQHNRSVRDLVTACILGCLLCGCSVVGPTAISNGRLAYNQAITETNNQQMLMIIVQNRYEEQGNLLAVSSVTANVRLITNTGIQLGFGNNDDFSGNLVPFGTSTIYEENPTISYVPVAGAKYTSRLMTPVPVEVLAQLAGTVNGPAYIFTTLVSSINGIKNPDFMFSPEEPDPRFNRLVELVTDLTRAQRLNWVKEPGRKGVLSLVIDRTTPAARENADALLRLLELPEPEDAAARVIVPFSLALDGRDHGGIGITTRSVYDLLEILSAAIEVPESDQRDGITTSYPQLGHVGKGLRIACAGTRPEHASVAVKYRNGWFYIDERDQATKQFFRLMGTLWSTTIAESASEVTSAPVLTVPVSR